MEAPLISLPQELFTDFDYNDDKEDEEEEECPTVGDEYLRESFPIKRISKEKNGYEVNIDGKYIKPVCKTAFATAKSWGNFASL
ncbi:MAG: hypothetical protein LBI53_06940 [Candidatus Peribacteria bacterium]|nr:hypothetical protein [Candidatus Peribacteria bacterium]